MVCGSVAVHGFVVVCGIVVVYGIVMCSIVEVCGIFGGAWCVAVWDCGDAWLCGLYGIVVVCGLAAVHGIGVKQIFIMVFSFASFVLTFLVSLVTSFSSSSS